LTTSGYSCRTQSGQIPCVNRTANCFVRIVERWMPDPFLFCVLLTVLCYALALSFTSTAPLPLIGHGR